LTSGNSYEFQVAASTRVGFGAFSRPLAVSKNPSPFRDPHAIYEGIPTDDESIVKQPWFIILIGCLVFAGLGVLVVVISIRRRLARKDGMAILTGKYFFQFFAKFFDLTVYSISRKFQFVFFFFILATSTRE
jgi:hypothetical protein